MKSQSPAGVQTVLAFCQRRIKERQSPAHERSVEQRSTRQLGVAASSLVSNTAQVYYGKWFECDLCFHCKSQHLFSWTFVLPVKFVNVYLANLVDLFLSISASFDNSDGAIQHCLSRLALDRILLTQSVDNWFHLFIALCENYYFLISNLHCSFTTATSCPQVLLSF